VDALTFLDGGLPFCYPGVRMALKSEINSWHWLITWDNPDPANSSSMLAALSTLGKATKVQTKTTILLAPKRSSKWRIIRSAIENNLHATKGNAVYLNLRSGRAFEFGSDTRRRWRRAN
jgi:hypothetical protein